MSQFIGKRRQRQLMKLIFFLTFSLIIFAAQRYGWLEDDLAPAQPGYYHVTSFADGDTIVVDMQGKPETIRFIGVDTPETQDPRKAVQCFGHAAANFTKNLISNNDVRLESDPENTNRDRYNRLLRYVYLPDGRLVNAEIIRAGYGFAYTSFPFQKALDFKSLEDEARTAGRGLWASCSPTINEYGGYTSNNE